MVAILTSVLLACPAWAGEVLPGPVPAEVIRVYDGDTMTVRAHIWPGLTMETSVRLDGVDTPELRARCESERRAAEAARDKLRALAGEAVLLRHVRPGKYAGRVVAVVETVDGRNLAAALVAEGLGRPYDGGRRVGWCD